MTEPAEGTIFTPNLNLAKQPTGAENWGEILNENFDKIDEAANKGAGLELLDIGISLFVDESENLRRILNGQVISSTQFSDFYTKLSGLKAVYPGIFVTESEWQEELANSKLGQCGKFVIDEELGIIRLPKVVNINGCLDLLNLGKLKDETLPNHIHGSLAASDRNGNPDGGADSGGGRAYWRYGTYYENTSGVKDNSTFVDGAPVQQEAIQYFYFIQVATGSTTSADIKSEIQLNNPFSLLDYKWSEYEITNSSWLISNGSFHSGATYVTVHQALVVENNANVAAGTNVTLPNGTSYTKRGLSVKLSTEEYTDYDFVLNTIDETFRLPIKVKLASGSAVAGNDMTLGLTDGTNNFGLHADKGGNANSQLWYQGLYGENVGTPQSGLLNAQGSLGITTDPTKSGIETSAQGLYLYFYVGETIQDANVIVASGVLTRISKLSDEYIVGLGIPDYSAGIAVSSGDFTPPVDGLLLGYTTAKGAGIDVSVNGVYLQRIYTNSDRESYPSLSLSVAKGETYAIANNKNSPLNFYPFKGTNHTLRGG